eukprot:TRINITY_DN6428_c0_g1_i2.p1 TRINITY_DN6428_c0_g1~~TRINITY_DN6428_c0_g1_i2.p1  ORF type:complete len:532 (+),score=102.57 TRINITY_DN6428_c0_g1_i2:160-1755(+)
MSYYLRGFTRDTKPALGHGGGGGSKGSAGGSKPSSARPGAQRAGISSQNNSHTGSRKTMKTPVKKEVELASYYSKLLAGGQFRRNFSEDNIHQPFHSGRAIKEESPEGRLGQNSSTDSRVGKPSVAKTSRDSASARQIYYGGAPKVTKPASAKALPVKASSPAKTQPRGQPDVISQANHDINSFLSSLRRLEDELQSQRQANEEQALAKSELEIQLKRLTGERNTMAVELEEAYSALAERDRMITNYKARVKEIEGELAQIQRVYNAAMPVPERQSLSSSTRVGSATARPTTRSPSDRRSLGRKGQDIHINVNIQQPPVSAQVNPANLVKFYEAKVATLAQENNRLRKLVSSDENNLRPSPTNLGHQRCKSSHSIKEVEEQRSPAPTARKRETDDYGTVVRSLREEICKRDDQLRELVSQPSLRRLSPLQEHRQGRQGALGKLQIQVDEPPRKDVDVWKGSRAVNSKNVVLSPKLGRSMSERRLDDFLRKLKTKFEKMSSQLDKLSPLLNSVGRENQLVSQFIKERPLQNK